MPTSNLFNGIAVVIDDEIEDREANINNLIYQIHEKNMPYITYPNIPDDEIIDHLEGISFLLFDWKFQTQDLTDAILDGVSVPSVITEAGVSENIEFLKKIKERYFCPIFIFTNEVNDTVISALHDSGLYHHDKPNFIFVKNKSELNENLFETIEEWAKKMPSIYVLKTWEREHNKAINRLFHDFYNFGPSWPKILWDNYKADDVNPSKELGKVINRNIHTRMAPFSFDETILNNSEVVQNDEVIKVLEGERFIRSDQLYDGEITTGDLFYGTKNEGGNEWYWLNVRAQCDLLRSSNPDIYCLRGKIITPSELKEKGVPFVDGQFIEKVHHVIVGCIDNGKIVEFSFREFFPIKWNKMKEKRIGRILPPHIIHIQQRYGLYLQRQGLPRTPEIAIIENGTSTTSEAV